MQIEEISIRCSDGIVLAGTRYIPGTIKCAVLICPATGIKRRFYISFAKYLAEQGYGVITFDNRGVGGSLNGDLNAINASLINWGVLDMSAALEELKTSFPGQSYHIIGHSAGGQLVGLMSNATEISSLFNFASSSGCLRNMQFPFILSASFFMNVFIPLSNLLFGKANCQWVGMGEPLPKLVAKQWSKWCRGKGYVETDFGKDVTNHSYDVLNFPSMWVHATDDEIANLENVKDMSRVFKKSKVEIVTLDPKEMGLQQIGHMGFFSSKKKNLWRLAVDWLERN